MKSLYRLLFASLLIINAGNCFADEKADTVNHIIPVDIVSGKIGDLNYRDCIEDIMELIGENRITAEYLEGSPSDIYLVDVMELKDDEIRIRLDESVVNEITVW